MEMTRRAMLAACAASALPACGADDPNADARGGSLGIVIHSYMQRVAADRAKPPSERIDDPVAFIEHAHRLGARGVQIGLRGTDPLEVNRVGKRLSESGMYLEGVVRLPRNRLDLGRFREDVFNASTCGARVLRTVLLTGRRYETFDSVSAFRKFAEGAKRSLEVARDGLGNLPVLLAVENHKDFPAAELVAILERLDSPRIGVCLDTGNNLALLEDPMEVVETLAPWTLTTHFKDMAVEPDRDGFLLSEVPLGTGILDLPRIVRTLRSARPEVRFNLEMITRDPLKVPCLTDRYWATFAERPALDLARALRYVRDHPPAKPLPRVSQLPVEERVRIEEENVRRSLAYARDTLGL